MGKLIKAAVLSAVLLGIALYILIVTFAPGDTPEAKAEFAKKELKKAEKFAKALLPKPAPGENGDGLTAILGGPEPEQAAPSKEVEVTVGNPAPAEPSPAKPPPPAPESTPRENPPVEAVAEDMPAPPAIEAKTVVHVVEEGETLYGIAGKYLGNPDAWIRIARANPQIDPDNIKPGEKVVIPSDENAPETGDTDPGFEAPLLELYEVKPGDTLFGLAAQFLGDGNRYGEILRANPGLDPDALAVGKKIRIPR